MLAYVMLVSPSVVQNTAQAATQYADLDSRHWAQANRTIEYDYDDNGSVVEKVTKETSTEAVLETVTYEYNLQNRLAKVTTTADSSTSVTEYKYDPDGNRVQKTVYDGTDSVVTDYLIDAHNHTGYAQVFRETRNTSPEPQVTTFIIGDDVLAQAVNSDAPQYLLYDGHGSTRQLIAADGETVADSYSYDAYGVMLSGNPGTASNPDAAATNLLYSGEQWDNSAQNYYLRARYYDPLTGRFNRTDPYSGNNLDPQSLHRYSYCYENPTNGSDPSGAIFISPAIRRLITAFGVSKAVRILVGIRVTYVLGEAYIRETGADPSATRINRWIARKREVSPEDWIEEFMLKPDIVDHGRASIYEIKRDWPHSIALGIREVLTYISVLARRYPERVYTPGIWQPQQGLYPILGLPGISGIGLINVRARNAGGGVIAYETVPREESIVWATVGAEIGMQVGMAIRADIARVQEGCARATMTSMLLGF